MSCKFQWWLSPFLDHLLTVLMKQWQQFNWVTGATHFLVLFNRPERYKVVYKLNDTSEQIDAWYNFFAVWSGKFVSGICTCAPVEIVFFGHRPSFLHQAFVFRYNACHAFLTKTWNWGVLKFVCILFHVQPCASEEDLFRVSDYVCLHPSVHTWAVAISSLVRLVSVICGCLASRGICCGEVLFLDREMKWNEKSVIRICKEVAFLLYYSSQVLFDSS